MYITRFSVLIRGLKRFWYCYHFYVFYSAVVIPFFIDVVFLHVGLLWLISKHYTAMAKVSIFLKSRFCISAVIPKIS